MELSNLTVREAAAGRIVTWRKLSKRASCDECLAIAYEAHVMNGNSPVAPARTVRSVAGSELYLCWPHAEAWKARDRGE